MTNIDILLAHPVPDKDLARLGIAAETPHNVGDTVSVTREMASALIGAGMAQVDPEDNAAVRAALTPGVAPTEGAQPADGQTEPVEPALLEGKALTEALKARDLPTSGTADEKRAAIAEYDSAHGVGH